MPFLRSQEARKKEKSIPVKTGTYAGLFADFAENAL
jgi:hypothetical protein